MHKQQQRKRTLQKSEEDLRNEGIVLIQNAIKAQSMAEPLVDSYFCNQSTSSDVNWACYLMQQSIELTLKGLIKYYGEYFREGHFVRFNAKTLEEMSADITELREISDILSELQSGTSVLLFKWESISRYNDLRVTRQNIEKIDQMLDDLMAFIRRHNYNL